LKVAEFAACCTRFERTLEDVEIVGRLGRKIVRIVTPTKISRCKDLSNPPSVKNRIGLGVQVNNNRLHGCDRLLDRGNFGNFLF
jgi:hypothetical protein